LRLSQWSFPAQKQVFDDVSGIGEPSVFVNRKVALGRCAQIYRLFVAHTYWGISCGSGQYFIFS
jgi:hypothetical protein